MHCSDGSRVRQFPTIMKHQLNETDRPNCIWKSVTHRWLFFTNHKRILSCNSHFSMTFFKNMKRLKKNLIKHKEITITKAKYVSKIHLLLFFFFKNWVFLYLEQTFAVIARQWHTLSIFKVTRKHRLVVIQYEFYAFCNSLCFFLIKSQTL